MARTPGQIINSLKKGDVFRNIADTSMAIDLSNKAIYLFWTTYPWRETLAELPPFYLIPNESDHVVPDVQIPTDFWALDTVQVVNINGSRDELRVASRLPRASYAEWPTSISYLPELPGFRIHPLPSPGMSAPWVSVEAVYKKRPPVITDDNFDTDPLPLDEMYQDVYEQALRYKYYEHMGDSRAGAVVYVRGVAQYSGQLGVYMGAVQNAIGRENLHRGQQIDAPGEPLAMGGFVGGY